MRMLWQTVIMALAGAVAAFAHPPWGHRLLFFVGFFVLARALLRASRGPRPVRAGALWGLVFGLGYFVVSVRWIGEAFAVEAERFGAMAPFAISGLALVLALFWAVAGAIVARFAPAGRGWAFVAAGVFALAEFARGHLFGGFPWALPGLIWTPGGAISQSAALIGLYGLTAVTLLLGFAVPLALIPQRRGGSGLALLAGVVALAGLFVFGQSRLQALPTHDISLRLVQGNIDQKDKWKPEHRAAILRQYLDLSALPGRADVIIWPEAAIPTPLLQDADALQAISARLHTGQILMAGSYRVDQDRYFNSLGVWQKGPAGLMLTGVYDKRHLVPFGEYLPLDGLFARLGLKHLVAVSDSGFTPGQRTQVLQAGPYAVLPLICYEALFAPLLRSPVRPDVIVTVSNDAWFGASSGPAQHLAQARYRSIEFGLPMARVTPTGITAMIDPFGRLSPSDGLGYGTAGVVDARLPVALPPTPFGQTGNRNFFILVLTLLLPVVWRKNRRG